MINSPTTIQLKRERKKSVEKGVDLIETCLVMVQVNISEPDSRTVLKSFYHTDKAWQILTTDAIEKFCFMY